MLPAQGRDQLSAIVPTLSMRCLPFCFSCERMRALFEIDIGSLPPTPQCCKVMIAKQRERKRRIGLRGQEGAFLAALKRQHPIGENTGFRHALAKTFRYAAQILSDDEASISMAFERQDADQVLERIADISSIHSRLVLRNQV